jgi:hypothetical protein
MGKVKIIQDLEDGYKDWSHGLSQYGIQTTYAIIAANWATYGKANAILSNRLSLLSIILCIVLLAINLFVQWNITNFYFTLGKGVKAESIDNETYVKSWKRIERWGVSNRLLFTFLPIISGTLYILSVLIDYISLTVS